MNFAGGVISASVQIGEPFLVQIERPDEVGQVDIRLAERVDGADVAPVRLGVEPVRTQLSANRCATALPPFTNAGMTFLPKSCDEFGFAVSSRSTRSAASS